MPKAKVDLAFNFIFTGKELYEFRVLGENLEILSETKKPFDEMRLNIGYVFRGDFS